MQTQSATTARNLYALYETLPDETQQFFLQELLQKQTDKLEIMALYLACRQAKEENDFLNENETMNFINSLPQ